MKRFLIVGGNSGIGLELGKLLFKQGYEVIQWSRSKGKLTEFTSEFSSFDTHGEIPELKGTLDGVVYLPGNIRLKPFHRIKVDEFSEDFQLNALGAARVLQAVHPNLKKSASASVVLFSTVAVQTGLPFHSSISMAKAAVEGLTKALAAEWAPSIRVNAIAPSLTDTPLAASILSNETRKEAVVSKNPLKKVGDPTDLAKLACFLLGEESSFITGQILTADGGFGSLRT